MLTFKTTHFIISACLRGITLSESIFFYLNIIATMNKQRLNLIGAYGFTLGWLCGTELFTKHLKYDTQLKGDNQPNIKSYLFLFKDCIFSNGPILT